MCIAFASVTSLGDFLEIPLRRPLPLYGWVYERLPGRDFRIEYLLSLEQIRALSTNVCL